MRRQGSGFWQGAAFLLFCFSTSLSAQSPYPWLAERRHITYYMDILNERLQTTNYTYSTIIQGMRGGGEQLTLTTNTTKVVVVIHNRKNSNKCYLSFTVTTQLLVQLYDSKVLF